MENLKPLTSDADAKFLQGRKGRQAKGSRNPKARPRAGLRGCGGLARPREARGRPVGRLFSAHGKIDGALYEELEAALLTADVGVEATQYLLDDLRKRVKRGGLSDSAQLKEALKQALVELLSPLAQPLDVSRARPFVIVMAGVNGAGKTTSIGKLARYFQIQGRSVLLAAGDTFRAAAREQLAVWGERNEVAVIAQQGGDAAAVIFDAVQAAKARGVDVLLADTAGRLTTQLHLMEEIKKVKRVIAKPNPPRPTKSFWCWTPTPARTPSFK